MSAFVRPFDDFRALLRTMPQADAARMAIARVRQNKLAKPQGTLGRLEEIAVWLCGWRAQEKPLIVRPLVAVFAGNHGVAVHDVSLYPPQMTKQMVENFAKGGAAINQICLANDLGLKVFDLALDYPTEDITKDAAMDERSCAATMAFGMEAIAGGTDLLCLGEMSNSNTTIAATMACLLFGGRAEDWASRDPRVSDICHHHRLEAVRCAVALHKPYCENADAFEVLRRVGGREQAAIIGAILAARAEKIPVILDSFATTVAAAVLYKVNSSALDHCLAGHLSADPVHRKILELIGKKPVLDLGLRLGEGSGAALAAGIVKSAALCHAQMADLTVADIAAEVS